MHVQTFVVSAVALCIRNVSRETVSTMTQPLEQLQQQCSEWGLKLGSRSRTLLSSYADLLATYELANVIGTKERERIVLEHILDSLSCLTAERVTSAHSIVDVGTGGGLPGIPLAIARPELRVTLLEATEKKARFLEHVRIELGLPNLEILHIRVEEAGRDPRYRDAFEIATARALAALPVVVEYCAPLVRPGGQILAMKGRLSEDELSAGLAAARELGAQLREVREVDYRPQLPQKERRLVIFDKVAVTPNSFPRRVGLAKRRPLRT
jgi:16S rRNA (guanine527-N7)-methyltransferase